MELFGESVLWNMGVMAAMIATPAIIINGALNVVRLVWRK